MSYIYRAVRHLPVVRNLLHNFNIKRRKEVLRGELQKIKTEAESYFIERKNPYGSIEDYREAFKKHWVSYSEYMYQYEFWKLQENQREEYVSRIQMMAFYRLYLPEEIISMFWNKKNFLKKFRHYIHRKWLDVENCSYFDFIKFVGQNDCIVKPGESCCGSGIVKLYSKDVSNLTEDYFNELKRSKTIIEECIVGCKELQAFHPYSLNTIRVVTLLENGRHKVLHAFFRTGTGGQIVDNAHAGGLFAQIDVETGVIVSDGISVDGKMCKVHPDSNIKFKGFAIPRWDEIKNVVIEAASSLPGLFICGWDVCITDKGEIELIEGNHGPDFDVMQSPLKKGYYNQINSAIKNYYNVNLKDLISIGK